MKNNYNRKAALLLWLCAMVSGVDAQLNGGLYTINSAFSTGGNNFQTFNDFRNALSLQGVSAAVTVNVVSGSGPYTEQVLFTPVTGASSVKRITINGNGNLLTFSSSNPNQPYVMGFNGADYFTVNNLEMSGTGQYAWVALFYNNADYNILSACSVSADINATYYDQIPILLNGNGNSISWSNGPTGNHNLFKGCTTYGGYYGIMIYGNYNQPLVKGNQVVDCHITDFYYQGISVESYNEDVLIKNNLIECPTITNNDWARMGIYCYGIQNTILDGNWVRNLFGGNTSSSDYCYGIYAGGNLESYYEGMSFPSTKPNYCRNNIVSDIIMDGSIFGIYGEGWDGYFYNNTVSLDDAASAGWGETHGIYSYGEASYYISHVINNIVTITRGGSGDMFGFYNASWTSSATDLPVERNDFYVNSASGTNYVGLYTNYATSLSALQSQGANVIGYSTDPVYTTPGSDYRPTNASINNAGKPMGLPLDQQKMPRSGTTPDIGALEFLSTPCTGTPSPGSVVTPTYQICAGESVDMILSNFSSDLGITYQWQYSTQSAQGQYFPISGANSVLHTAENVTVSTWYQVIVTCTNSSQFVSPVGHVTVAASTTSTVPYFEGFEGIGRNNRLPNCSWYTTELGGSAKTYTAPGNNNKVPRTGSSFASYYYSPSGTRSMFTNGIWMEAGITYSASVWYTTEFYGYNNWTNLSIRVGPNQNSTGQQVVASKGPAVSVIYKSLSGTFMVPTSGLYYVEIKALVDNSSYAYNLSWDDLAIEIPCHLNLPPLDVSSNQNTVCANTQVFAQATGADTYSWSTGEQVSQISPTPVVPGPVTYYVTGTNTLAGCALTLPLHIMVNPSPQVYVYTTPSQICPGDQAFLQAFGADNYVWQPNGAGSVITVKPAATTTYVVVGSNQFNCQSTAMAQITVHQLPSITATHPSTICLGDLVPINANGAVTYEFISSNSYHSSNPAMVSPRAATQYSVVGTDANGCKNTYLASIGVEECVGLNENSALAGLLVYPNPTPGTFMLELNNGADKHVVVTDMTGRVILSSDSSNPAMQIDLGEFAKGVYFVKMTSQLQTRVVKVIKE